MTQLAGRFLSVSISAVRAMVIVALVGAGSVLAAPAVAGADPAAAAVPAAVAAPGQPDLGPNVHVFDPSMPRARSRPTVDAIAAQQMPEPVRHRSATRCCSSPAPTARRRTPLNFQVGYYTEVAGLGAVTRATSSSTASVYVRNQCDGSGCIALNNFWRSLSNLTINVTNRPDFGCYSGEFWAVSQAAPMRRVHVNGQTTLMDYCTGPSFASGGFIADSRFDGSTVINGSQQQFFVRNSTLGRLDQRGVEPGVLRGGRRARRSASRRSRGCGGPYTTLPTTPVSKEKPYLYVDAGGRLPGLRPVGCAADSVGDDLGGRTRRPAARIPLSDFYVATPADSVAHDQQPARPRAATCCSPPASTTSTTTISVKRAGHRRARASGCATPDPAAGGAVAMTVARRAGRRHRRHHVRRRPA